MQFLKKLWEMLENKKIFNFPKHKEEDIIKYQNQTYILHIFFLKIY